MLNLQKDFLRLEVLRFPLIVLVVYIHAGGSAINVGNTTVGLVEMPSPYADIQYLMIKIARLAVPLFFLSSGFLFFREGRLDYPLYKIKILTRVRTLLVPFLAWNIGLFSMVYIAQQLPQFAPFFNSMNVQISDMTNFQRLDAILGITRYPIAYQFWFIRDLMVLILCSPFVYVAIRLFGSIFLLFLCALWITHLWPVSVPDIEPVFFFALGAYCGVKQISLFQLDDWGKVIFASYVVVLASALIFRSGVPAQIIHAVTVLLGVVSALALSKELVSKESIKKVLLFLAPMSFFVFATHEPLMTILKKVTYRYVEMTPPVSFATYLIGPLFVIMISVALCLIANKSVPRTLAVLTGGRIAR